jgi:hypothetical protein
MQKIGDDLEQTFGPLLVGLKSFETKILEAVARIDPNKKPGLPPEADILGIFNDINNLPEISGSITLPDGTLIYDGGVQTAAQRTAISAGNRDAALRNQQNAIDLLFLPGLLLGGF